MEEEGKKAVEVVAALIRRGARFLICQRPAHKARGLLWEFVGGKVEAGETAEEALVREIKEELDTLVSVDEFFMTVEYDYPEFHISMDCFICSIISGELTLPPYESEKEKSREAQVSAWLSSMQW